MSAPPLEAIAPIPWAVAIIHCVAFTKIQKDGRDNIRDLLHSSTGTGVSGNSEEVAHQTNVPKFFFLHLARTAALFG